MSHLANAGATRTGLVLNDRIFLLRENILSFKSDSHLKKEGHKNKRVAPHSSKIITISFSVPWQGNASSV